MLEVPRDARKLPGVHVPGGLEQHGLGLAHLCRPHVLGGPGHGHRVLVADLAASKRLFSSGQLLELPGGLHVVGGGAGGELAVGAQPGRHAQRAVGPVAPGLLEAAGGLTVDGLHPVDDLAPLDDRRTQLTARLPRQPARQFPDRRLDSLEGRFAGTARGASMRQGYDSCLS